MNSNFFYHVELIEYLKLKIAKATGLKRQKIKMKKDVNHGYFV